jgi:hypothetical protein
MMWSFNFTFKMFFGPGSAGMAIAPHGVFLKIAKVFLALADIRKTYRSGLSAKLGS